VDGRQEARKGRRPAARTVRSADPRRNLARRARSVIPSPFGATSPSSRSPKPSRNRQDGLAPSAGGQVMAATTRSSARSSRRRCPR
jgi:hypothetical protein